MCRDIKRSCSCDVVHSMSNHDYQSGFHLAHSLKSWFRNTKDVTFDISVAHRKYYKYGSNLIGLEHGDGAKMDKLPMLMANENRKNGRKLNTGIGIYITYTTSKIQMARR